MKRYFIVQIGLIILLLSTVNISVTGQESPVEEEFPEDILPPPPPEVDPQIPPSPTTLEQAPETILPAPSGIEQPPEIVLPPPEQAIQVPPPPPPEQPVQIPPPPQEVPQETVPAPEPEPQPELRQPITEEEETKTESTQKKEGFRLFKKSNLQEKQSKEKTELLETYRRERKEVLERHKKEREEAREKRKKEREEEFKKLKEEKAKQENLDKKTYDIQKINRTLAREEEYSQKKHIKKVKKLKKYVEAITNKEDPVYILDTGIKKSKTAFMKIPDVELNYFVKVQNQTPKVINSFSLVWERKIPFTEALNIQKEVKVSKPLIPYEKRTIKFNELDSKRDGESYRLKIAKIIFEDGSQWVNPSYKASAQN